MDVLGYSETQWRKAWSHAKCTIVQQHVWMAWHRRDHEICVEYNAVGDSGVYTGAINLNDTKQTGHDHKLHTCHIKANEIKSVWVSPNFVFNSWCMAPPSLPCTTCTPDHCCIRIERWWSTTNCLEIHDCLRSQFWHESHPYVKKTKIWCVCMFLPQRYYCCMTFQNSCII